MKANIMEKATIEIKMTNTEVGEITEIKYSTDDIRQFLEISDELIQIINEKASAYVNNDDVIE